jgi:hypothetical protein
MDPVLKELNYKDQPNVLVLNAPDSFQNLMADLDLSTRLSLQLGQEKSFDFMMTFVRYQHEIDHLVPLFNVIMPGDGIFWCAYPKASSEIPL